MNRVEKWILIVACIVAGISWLGIVYKASSGKPAAATQEEK